MSTTAATVRPSPAPSRVLGWATRAFDVRAGEGGAVALAFSILLLLISGHTMLETARDTLLLARLPRQSLGIVYILIAAFTLPAGAIATAMSNRMGPRRALSGSLVVAAVLVALVRTLPASPGAAMTLYVLTGIIGAVLVPQFWAFTTGLFNIAQGRRLLGPIASAGVIGGVVGSGLAALIVRVVHTRHLLLVAAGIFLLAAGRILTSPIGEESRKQLRERRKQPVTSSAAALSDIRRDPFVLRVAGLVTISTAAVLALDYMFKWSVAESIHHEQLGQYLASYYTLINGVSLVMQLFVGGALVRRLGVTAAALVTPGVLLLATVAMAVTGGSHVTVLIAKGADGALRHSVHRITTELVYLPVNSDTRARVKPFIDGAMARVVQAITACVMLGLAGTGHLSRWHMMSIVGGLVVAWFLLAANTRRPYLDIFRRALARGHLESHTAESLDFASVEFVVERLGSRKPEEVNAAMRVLKSRGRERLIPALILYHPSPEVLTCAIEVVCTMDRTDWVDLAEGLVTHSNEAVRMAALRALCRLGRLDLLQRMASNNPPGIRAYIAVWLALRQADESGAKITLEGFSAQLADVDPSVARDGFFAALSDTPARADLGEVLLTLLQTEQRREPTRPDAFEAAERSLEWIALAAGHQRDERTLPLLIERLAVPVGRDFVRDALAAFGDPAFHEVLRRLRDPATPRLLRIHLPRTLARFGNQAAADALLSLIEREQDGLVRFKAIRGLEMLAVEKHVRIDPRRVVQLTYANLVEFLRLLSLRVSLGIDYQPGPRTDARRAFATLRFMEGLLDDKMQQALDRAARLLKVEYPHEDIHAVHRAALSDDAGRRAQAGEFLDTLLVRSFERDMRGALRLIIDDLSDLELATRGARISGLAPTRHADVVRTLSADRDEVLARIATDHVNALGEIETRAAEPTQATAGALAYAG